MVWKDPNDSKVLDIVLSVWLLEVAQAVQVAITIFVILGELLYL